ncbi:hypothetical protein VTK26DRAFT_9064 [Humicola hyalothermophila]
MSELTPDARGAHHTLQSCKATTGRHALCPVQASTRSLRTGKNDIREIAPVAAKRGFHVSHDLFGGVSMLSLTRFHCLETQWGPLALTVCSKREKEKGLSFFVVASQAAPLS